MSRAAGSNLKSSLGAALLLAALSAPAPTQAQEEPEAPPAEELELEPGQQAGSLAEARSLLAQPLPADGAAAYELLQRQYRAAQRLEDRPRQIALAQALSQAGPGRPGGEAWVRSYLSAEFTWGSPSLAQQACEPFISDRRLSLRTRAEAALRQAYFAAHGQDRAILSRIWSRADGLARQAMEALEVAREDSTSLAIDRLQVRSELQRWEGDLAGSLASLREAVGLGRQLVQRVRQQTGASEPARLDAYGWLDGSLGMLTYALVRQGRAREAIDVAEANLSLWQRGELSDGLGARWSYRLATALVATQQYERGLAAAQRSDEMLARAGAHPASHTRWLARAEIVRALMGLKRWAEADSRYREFLAEIGPDSLAQGRARDNRLLALLAAKNGRLDEALELAERSHRYRLRLYGAAHPQTQEAAGVRAVVRLLRGDQSGALADYEALFSATLDRPGGWLDLDLRGLRGYVLGLAFAEFMDHIAARLLKGEVLPPVLQERALQIADRSKVGATQRALADSTARVLAATPELRALLEQEQQQRLQVAALFGRVNSSLGEEDRLRREMSSDAFKALPKEQRKVQEQALKALRDTLKMQQAEALAARAQLEGQREQIAAQYPAYADLLTPAMPTLAQLRGLLAPGEALVLLHSLEHASLVWLIGFDGRLALHASPVGAVTLAQRVMTLRAQLDLGSQTGRKLGQAQALAPELAAGLYGLYRELLLPLEPQLRAAPALDSLLLASDGALAGLPMAALLSEPWPGSGAPAWLLRRFALSQLPAAAALQALRRGPTPSAAPQAMLGFADPLFRRGAATPAPAAPASKPAAAGRVTATVHSEATRYDAVLGFRYADVPPLPDTRAELQAVATSLGADPQRDLRLGAAATRRAVLTAPLLDRRVLAFATHGLMPGELPGISKPALAMAADADENESPLLELDDVLGLRLNAQWVLLSACNTAAGEAGGAAMSGLVRGFFFSGARSVLATHWAVETASAGAVSAATFQAARPGSTLSRAQALRQAQLALADGRQGGGRWTHPFFWAPYALFGDPLR